MHRRQFHRQILAGSAVAAGVTASSTLLPGQDTAAAAKPVPTFRDCFGLLKSGKKIPVIFDTDLGSDIDDTWALLYLLKCPELDCKLIATDSGQGVYRTTLAAKFLESIGRTDVPLGRCPLGHDGLGNQRDWIAGYSLDSYPGTIHDDAVDAIIQTIHASPDPVTLICVGTVPNIAEALRRDPTICQNARFVGMHGSIYKGYGDSPTPSPESNVRYGVEPLRRTLSAPWECSITPLDTCGVLELDGDRYQAICQSKATGIAELMGNYRAWLDRVDWLAVKPDPALKSSTLFDLVAVAMAFSEKWLHLQTLPLSVTDDGMTVVDSAGDPVRCALSWLDLSGFQDHLVERLIS